MSKKGKLVFREIVFEDVLVRTVVSNNKTSGKVQLPKELVGKNVYVVVVNDAEVNEE